MCKGNIEPNNSNGTRDESKLQWYISGKKMYSFFSTFYIILGELFFISFIVLKNTKNVFLKQIIPLNSCYLSKC
jgi:hypothetical protein